MSDIYVAEVSFDTVILTPALSPTAVFRDASGVNPSNVVGGGVVFEAADLMGNRFAIRIGAIRTQTMPGDPVHWASFASFRIRHESFPSDTLNPWNWETTLFPLSSAMDITDTTGVGYLGGGTLSITKDYAHDQIIFTCPVGTSTFTLTQAGSSFSGATYNPTPIYPLGIGALASFPADPLITPLNAQAAASFYDFQAKKNGRVIFRHTLSSTDPGPLQLFDEQAYDDFLSPISTLGAPHDDQQLTSRHKFGYTVTTTNYYTHQFNEIWGTLEQPPLSNDIDMEIAHQHGLLFRAGPGSTQGADMWFTRSWDNGGHWDTIVIVNPGLPGLVSSPSLNWVNSGLYLCYHDGTNIVEVKSLDAGATWSLPTTIPFAGTNPRRIANKQGGPNLLFYINSGGDLLVVVTYDNGQSWGGPYTVALNVGAQQIDAEFAPDSSIVCSYTDTGIWTQKRSRDLGRTWT